jgi:hypothetical protein
VVKNDEPTTIVVPHRVLPLFDVVSQPVQDVHEKAARTEDYADTATAGLKRCIEKT